MEEISVAGIGTEDLIKRFTVVDYIVCLVMLTTSAGIGIFYGCFQKKMKNASDFLMAGKSMTTFPVAMSLIASFMSAVTLLGMPAEVYSHGFISWLIIIATYITIPVTVYCYFPVYWNNQVTSVFQYLELRFTRSIRLFGAALYVLQMSLYMAIALYAPSLALAQVTGINVHLSVTVLCFVCIFYTTLGGMKAVLWTDALQVMVMYLTMIFIVINGFIEEGGITAVWEANTRGNRTALVDWDLNPTKRNTCWSLLIGMYFGWLLIYGINQAQVQRYLCVKEKYMAIRAIWINLIGLTVFLLLSMLMGLIIYSKYETCDPLKSGLVTKGDQLLPLFVMDTFGTWKGIPGLFVAGIFAATLSTISSGINSLATITIEDFAKKGCFPNLSEKNCLFLSKLFSVFYGLLTFGLVFVVERLGNVFSAAVGIFGIIGGPLCGLFSLGMFFPWANSTGAFCGSLIGLALTFWINLGFNINVIRGNIVPTSLPVNTYGCHNMNQTLADLTIDSPFVIPEEENLFLSLYRISYLWYSSIGFFSVIIFGMLISFLTGFQDVKKVDPNLLSPLVHRIKRILPGGNLIGKEAIIEVLH